MSKLIETVYPKQITITAMNQKHLGYHIYKHSKHTLPPSSSSVSSSMRVSGYLVLAFFCLLVSVIETDAKKKPAKGKGKGKGSQSNAQVEECPCDVSQPEDLNCQHAMEMIRLVTEKATEVNTPVVICIRDRHDNLVAHLRMKDAMLGSIDLACQKARSSALFPFPSGGLVAVPGIEMSNGIISNLAGGLPLTTSSGVSVGSIGVSGASSGELDEEIAKVAADAIDDILANF